MSKQQIAAIWLADQAPTTLGLPLGRWSLAKLRAYLIRQHCPHDQPRAPAPGAEKRGYTLRRVRRKLFSTDPNRHLILHRLRTWWHNRPRGAILAFSMCSRSRQGVCRRTLHTGQTLGTAAEPEDPGAVLLLFLPGQPGPCPLGLLSRQGGEVCLSLPAAGASVVSPAGGADRLGSRSGGSIKARMTRRTMRQLRLRWTSMPKGSPDDNPAETIFSDIQQNILDNTDDPASARPKVASRPFASTKSPTGPVHSHSLPGG